MKQANLNTFMVAAVVCMNGCGRDTNAPNTATTRAGVASTATTGQTSTGGEAAGTGTAPTPTPSNTSTPAGGATPSPIAALDPDTCTVNPGNELMITRVSVVEDAVRTAWSGGPGQDGAWAVGRVLSRLSGSPDATLYVNSLLNALVDDDIFIAANWPKTARGYSLNGNPMVLDAIVNRIDLRNPAASSMGELRFVFGTNVPGSNLDGKMIVEIVVPPSATYSALSWAQAWHRLSDPNLTSAQFNTALQVLTDYALDNAQSHYRVRTANETPLQPWTFRQFEPQSGLLAPANLTLTPAARYDKISLDDPNSFFGPASQIQASQIVDPNDRAALLAFVQGIATDVANGNYSIPASMGAPSFQMQSAYRFEQNKVGSDESWSIPTVSAVTGATFSVNTCNGCHGLPVAVGPSPAQVGHRVQGLASPLADFLTGTTDGKFNDLQRRANDMSDVLCGNGATQAGATIVVPRN